MEWFRMLFEYNLWLILQIELEKEIKRVWTIAFKITRLNRDCDMFYKDNLNKKQPKELQKMTRQT